MTPRPAPPRATYRLQFNAAFRFEDAARLAPYLAALGVSHVYASPYLKARPGTTHGYDIIDHGALNPELGDARDFRLMCEAFKLAGLGQILDFVPNHMGVWGADNALWLDVLEWGRGSDHAGWFDIDWEPDDPALRGKLLAPILGDQYGAELKAGRLVVKFDDEEGGLALWAYDVHKLPLCPLTYGRALGRENEDLDRLGDLFADLPNWRPEMGARTRELKARLAMLAREKPQVRAALERSLAALNADWRALDELIGMQFWRAAYFSVAGDEINYRRFFDVNDLAGLRMELPAVFRHVHALVLPMLEEGLLDGLRIDHIDGLLDPKAYLAALRASVTRPFYLVVEKILASHEALRDWDVDGTTGYEFANLALGVLIDPAAEAAMTQAYDAFVGRDSCFSDIVHQSKIRIMDNEMASELNMLASDAARVARQNPMTTDFTKRILRRALRQIVACFPVYRAYLDFDSGPQEADRRYLDWAVAQARRVDRAIDASVFDFLASLLSGRLASERYSGFSRAAALRFCMKLQQYSGPVMAKGLEDTAFYRYNRFIALNEVGGEPGRFGVKPAAFHKASEERARSWPRAMLATSTHDAKRGEDVRARLAALADIPDEWARQTAAWSRLLRARRGDVEGDAPPDRDDEYLLYQLLVGSWPAGLLHEPDAAGLEAYAKRLEPALTKSVREAKLRSFWAAPDGAYEEALISFARAALDAGNSAFLSAFLPFARRLARWGVDNSLAQLALKLTAPGLPDFYQGCELWDLNLVDPDNRRPVDFAARERALGEIAPLLDGDREAAMRALLGQWEDGRVKLAATSLLLDLRRRAAALFAEASYQALPLEGGKADRALGFLRTGDGAAVATLVARFPGRREADPGWGDAAASLPDGAWSDVLTGRRLNGGPVPLAEVFAVLPCAVFVRA